MACSELIGTIIGPLFILFIFMQAKYEEVPSPQVANWLLFTMIEAEDINFYFEKFPKKTNNIGCSASLLWSGVKDNNVPINVHGNKTLGLVLNPKELIVPQADLAAYKSGGRLAEETLKSEDHKTKYPTKAGYFRRAFDETHFVVNIARNEHIGQKQSIYHEEGSTSIFAKNIWRKYYKKYSENSIMRLNEAIVFQKDNNNPIIGFILTEAPKLETAKQLLIILKNNKNFSLYFYDKNAKEHIIRFLPNDFAVNWLKKENLNFKAAFANALYYRGYSALTDELFFYEENDLSYSNNDGTHVVIKSTNNFFQWFSQLAMRQPIELDNGYKAFKINEDTVSINKGAGTPGVQIKKQGNNFLVCNNITADEAWSSNSEREQHLKNTLTELKKAIVSNLHKNTMIVELFSYTENDITYSHDDGTHVGIKITDNFYQWFSQLAMKQPIELDNGYKAFKINEDTVSINKGVSTPGVQIKKQGNNFLVCNNITADVTLNSSIEKEQHLKTTLADLKKIISFNEPSENGYHFYKPEV